MESIKEKTRMEFGELAAMLVLSGKVDISKMRNEKFLEFIKYLNDNTNLVQYDPDFGFYSDNGCAFIKNNAVLLLDNLNYYKPKKFRKLTNCFTEWGLSDQMAHYLSNAVTREIDGIIIKELLKQAGDV